MTESANAAQSKVEVNSVTPPFKPWVVILVNVQALLFGGVITWLAWNVGKPQNGVTVGGTHFAYLNLLIVVLGSCLGWLIGTLASPYNKGETSKFNAYAHAISAFVSGYILSKADKLITSVLDPEGSRAFDNTGWERFGLFVAALIVMALIVYINRSYFNPYTGFAVSKSIQPAPRSGHDPHVSTVAVNTEVTTTASEA
jgi:hypothetical protein